MSARAGDRHGSAQRPVYAPTVPTVAARLERASRRLALVRAVSPRPLAVDEDDDGIHAADLRAAVGEILLDIGEELYWLRLLPGPVLRRPAPDDDDFEAVHGHTRPRRAVRA